MFSTADLEIRNVPFPKKVSGIYPRDTYGSYLGLTWLLPKDIIYYCPMFLGKSQVNPKYLLGTQNDGLWG